MSNVDYTKYSKVALENTIRLGEDAENPHLREEAEAADAELIRRSALRNARANARRFQEEAFQFISDANAGEFGSYAATTVQAQPDPDRLSLYDLGFAVTRGR